MRYKGYEVFAKDDVGDNDGGYYCEVYKGDMQLGTFSIHVCEINKNPNVEYWLKKHVDNLEFNQFMMQAAY